MITATGNITGGNIITGGALSVTGNANIGNIGTGVISVTTGLTSARTDVPVFSGTAIDSFDPTKYRTAKYVLSASSDNGYQSVETLLVHDGVHSYITIYGSLSTNASADIIDVTTDINGITGNVTLYATAIGTNVMVNLVASYIQV